MRVKRRAEAGRCCSIPSPSLPVGAVFAMHHIEKEGSIARVLFMEGKWEMERSGIKKTSLPDINRTLAKRIRALKSAYLFISGILHTFDSRSLKKALKCEIRVFCMKTKSTFFVGATGSFEEVTVKKWKRLRVLSHKSIGNLTNISDEVLARRSAMTQLGDFLTASGEIVKRGFIQFQNKISWWPMFMGVNLSNAFNYGSAPVATVIPANLVISQGTLGKTPISAVEISAATGNWSCTFSTSVGFNQSSDDQLFLLFYNRNTGEYQDQGPQAARSEGSAAGTLGEISFTAGDTVDVWSFFNSYDAPAPYKSGNTSYNVVTVSA